MSGLGSNPFETFTLCHELLISRCMTRITFIIVTLVFITACDTAQNPNEFNLSGFKFGYVCPNPGGSSYPGQTTGVSEGDICQASRRIDIQGDQNCIFNGKSEPCTWYGYEFEYENMPEPGVINCTWRTSVPTTEGNPNEVNFENETQGDFELTVSPGSGRFYNPLYTLYFPNEGEEIVIEEYVVCRLDSEVIFEVDYETFHAAKLDIP